jgi:uncharacterized membrane protein YphA (DoxX/SURF4 family)
MKFIEKYKGYAPITVRMGVAIVFLWFGINQLINPESFLGYVPQWFYQHSAEIVHNHPFQLLHNLPLGPHLLVMGNGVFETLFGSLLLLGVFTRLTSFLLSMHLLFIVIGLGYNDVAVRDFGLMLATFSVFLNGPDKASLDRQIDLKRLKLSNG